MINSLEYFEIIPDTFPKEEIQRSIIKRKVSEKSLIQISDLSAVSITLIQLSELILEHMTWIVLDYSTSHLYIKHDSEILSCIIHLKNQENSLTDMKKFHM